MLKNESQEGREYYESLNGLKVGIDDDEENSDEDMETRDRNPMEDPEIHDKENPRGARKPPWENKTPSDQEMEDNEDTENEDLEDADQVLEADIDTHDLEAKMEPDNPSEDAHYKNKDPGGQQPKYQA